MTNLVVELLTIATLSTNWTCYTLNGKEAGVVVTNYDARLKYDGTHNVVPLNTEPSGITVWRVIPPPTGMIFLTNAWPQNFQLEHLHAVPMPIEFSHGVTGRFITNLVIETVPTK